MLDNDFQSVPYRPRQPLQGRRSWLATFFSVCLLCSLAGLILWSHLCVALGMVRTTTLHGASSLTALLQQDRPPLPLVPGVPGVPGQMRAVWIATVSNIDWPAHSGLSIAEQQHEFRQQLDEALALHFNTVIVQVRPSTDAFYPSRYAPWSQYLTGVQGRAPGYDPLAFMLSEAHRRHMALHAWFNPYRVSVQNNLSALASTNPARLHPDWVVHYGGRLYFDPGLPEVGALVTQSILEVVQHYPIDGVQLDDYFYPYPVARQAFPDAASYLRYGAAKFPVLADWRRDNINRLIAGLSQGIKTLRPSVQFGISPFGVWRNLADDPTGSATHAGVTDYDTLYADTRSWIRHNWLDYIAPQLYWPIDYPTAAYNILLPWWVKEVAGSHVRLYIGQSAYNITRWNDPQELRHQLQLNQQYAQVAGSIFFSMKGVLHNAQYFRSLWLWQTP